MTDTSEGYEMDALVRRCPGLDGFAKKLGSFGKHDSH